MVTELRESELRAAGLTPALFVKLPINERRWIASALLRARAPADKQSHFAANMMERANPNFTQFTVLFGV